MKRELAEALAPKYRTEITKPDAVQSYMSWKPSRAPEITRKPHGLEGGKAGIVDTQAEPGAAPDCGGTTASHAFRMVSRDMAKISGLQPLNWYGRLLGTLHAALLL